MDGFDRQVIARLPLAEAVLLLWKYVLTPSFLQEIWEESRGRCYERILTFPTMVKLVADSLIAYASALESFKKNAEQGILEASIQATYKKLSRIPIAVSQAFLRRTSRGLREIFPVPSRCDTPKSLEKFKIVILDGKALKHVQKRLKALRGRAGGLLGGRALVAIDWNTGLAIAMHAHPDGEANEVRFVKDLMPVIVAETSGPRLYVGDRGFSDLEQPRHFTAEVGDHFLIRHHVKVKFHMDASVPIRQSHDAEGRRILESWGWIGGEKDKRRRPIRRIEFELSNGDPLVLLTDLLDADEYPAVDLLYIYKERWQIERMFQKVTEVFDLRKLIGGTPEASIFQFSFSLVLYNMIQTIREGVAVMQELEPEAISMERLFNDVERQCVSWNELIPSLTTEEYFDDAPLTPVAVRRRLRKLLSDVWSNTWLASPRQKQHRTTPRNGARSHGSVYRILNNIGRTKRPNLPP